MDPGLYLTFFTEGETSDEELPPVGPLEHIVIREHVLLADRSAVVQAAGHPGAGHWTEGELELRRAMGIEPGGARRPHLRIAALGGVYLRFLSFAEADEPRPLSELGPFDLVVLGPRGVEADGELVAAHSEQDHAGWELTGEGTAPGAEFRPDIAFRAGSTYYYPGIGGARLVLPVPSDDLSDGDDVSDGSETAAAPEPSLGAPAAHEEAPGTPPDAAPPQPIFERIAIARQTVDPPGVDRATRFSQLDALVEAAWRFRIGLAGAAVLLIAVFALGSFRTMLAPQVSAGTSVLGLGSEVMSSRWAYSVTSARRVTTAGSVRAQGIFMVVEVAVTNRGPNGAQLSPSVFLVVDAERKVYSALPAANAVYQGNANPGTPFVWTQTYPAEKSVGITVIFDVNPSIRSPQLAITELPGVRIRLE